MTVKAPMTGSEILVALDECGAIFLSFAFVRKGEADYLRWRDKSKAMRSRVKTLVKDVLKKDPLARFNARVSDSGVEKTLIIGEKPITGEMPST